MCSVNPLLLSSTANPAAIGFRKKAVSGAVALLAAWVGYTTLVFPGHRVVKWYEICTDNMAPDWLASESQNTLGTYYGEAMRRGFLNEISGAVVEQLSQWGGADVLEIAAGNGDAASVWHSLFAEKGLCTRTILTDIQPNLQNWKRVARDAPSPDATALKNQDEFDFDCGTFSYVASPVDATSADTAVDAFVPNFGDAGKELRMIHLALHHFDPDQVQKMLQDAIGANAAFLIIDHSPTAGGALYNWSLTLTRLLRIMPNILIRNPIKVLLAPLVPAILAGLWHDATVSILRSYSQSELEHMIRSADGGDKYGVKMFKSAGYGEWIGVPSFMRGLFPSMDDHVMNFVLATPPTPPNGVYTKRRVQHDVPTSAIEAEVNQTVKVYGAPAHAIPESAPVTPGMQMLILLLVGAASYKLLVDNKPKKKKRIVGEDDGLVGAPSILAIGTAVPPNKWTSDEIYIGLDWKRNNIKLGEDFVPFMKKVHQTSGVETRFFGDPAPSLEMLESGDRPPGIYGGDGNPSTTERHAYWEEWCPKMAIEAATKAVNNWGGNKSDITHVIFHSCTGFKAPGVELDIIDALKLTGVQRRLGINYMGCFGAFTGMSVAKSFCDADPNATVLLVCSETCFAHIAFSENRSKTIGNCFFADGAGAAIIGAGKPGDWAISDQQTKTLGPETRSLMTWRPSDNAYDMYLDKGIGLKFGMHLYWNLKSYLQEICPESVRDIEWCVHPGGKGILDFFCSEKLNLGIDKSTLKRSYDILRNYGNMSSPTILFVLEEMMNEAKKNPSNVKDTAVCFGFGPGLTLEIAELRRIGSTPGSSGAPSQFPSFEESFKTIPSDSEETAGTDDESQSKDSKANVPSDISVDHSTDSAS